MSLSERQEHSRSVARWPAIRLALAAYLCALCVVAPIMVSSAFAYSAAVESAKVVTVAIYDSTAEIVGSGVIIAPEWVLTAGHVADYVDANGLDQTLKTQDGMRHPYTIAASAADPDLALLRVPGLIGPVIARGAAGSMSAGDEVYALGYPLGLEAISVTKGVVSAPVQVMDGSSYLQTDASINPGNSGGPLVDGQGRLVGINVAKASMVGVDSIGFAVPADKVSEFLAGTPLSSLQISTGSGSSSAQGSGGGAQPDGSGTLLLFGLVIGGALIAYVVYSTAHSATAISSSSNVGIAPVQRYEPSPASGGFTVRLLIEGPMGRRELSANLPAVIGRSSSAEIVLGDTRASRHHARLIGSSQGVRVHDLSSRNGTLVGGVRQEDFGLTKGASFTIGETTVTRIG